mgnify:CR=1 FL=1
MSEIKPKMIIWKVYLHECNEDDDVMYYLNKDDAEKDYNNRKINSYNIYIDEIEVIT